jgi:hypothetical protein
MFNKKALSDKYKKDFKEMQVIVNEYDPLDLVKNGAPNNEHDRLTTELLSLLYKNQLDGVRELLIHCYEWYGYNPDEIKEEYKERFNNKVKNTLNKIENLYKNNFI